MKKSILSLPVFICASATFIAAFASPAFAQIVDLGQRALLKTGFEIEDTRPWLMNRTCSYMQTNLVMVLPLSSSDPYLFALGVATVTTTPRAACTEAAMSICTMSAPSVLHGFAGMDVPGVPNYYHYPAWPAPFQGTLHIVCPRR